MVAHDWAGGYRPAMSLLTRLQEDLKKAMLAKNEVARDALRGLKADLLNREVELGRPLEETEEVAALKSAVKSRRDSFEQYQAGGREDLAAKERSEIEIIEQYLPKQLSEEALRAAITALAAELSVTKKQEMGKLMKELKARFDGQYDGKLASTIIGTILS